MGSFFFVPNIEGDSDFWVASNSKYNPTGCFGHRTSDKNLTIKRDIVEGENIVVPYINSKFNNAIYGIADTVQPNSLKVLFVIKY